LEDISSRSPECVVISYSLAALAAALLRQLHAVITTGQRWNPVIAAGGRKDHQRIAA